MKKNKIKKGLYLILVILLVVIPTRILANQGDYNDHWAKDHIEKIKKKGVMQGDADGKFRPNDDMTRGEFAMTIWNYRGQPDSKSDNFKDVNREDYYYQAVNFLYEEGIVNGSEKDLFEPKNKITREMAFAIVSRNWKLEANDIDIYKKYKDWKDVSNWAIDEISAAIENNYIEGLGENTLSPKGLMTRAQMAALMSRMVDGEENDKIEILEDQKMIENEVEISLTINSKNKIKYKRYRLESEKDYVYITDYSKFMVNKNGKYILEVEDDKGNKAIKTIEVNSIKDNNTLEIGTVLDQSSYGEVKVKASKPLENNKYPYNSEIIIEAIPKENYTFAGWYKTEDIKSEKIAIESTYKFNITEDTKLYARFNGNGENKENPIEIVNQEELLKIKEKSNRHYKLMNHIRFSIDKKWNPIENFSGSLDGNNNTISNIEIHDNEKDNVGFFRELNGIVENVNIVTEVVGRNNIGGLAGTLGENGKIYNTSISGKVATIVSPNTEVIGGIVGRNNGIIKKSNFVGIIEGQDIVGGVAGISNKGLISDNYVWGDINGKNIVGGIAGKLNKEDNSNNEVLNNYIVGEIKGEDIIGGITGLLMGSDNQSLSTNKVLNNLSLLQSIDGTDTSVNRVFGEIKDESNIDKNLSLEDMKINESTVSENDLNGINIEKSKATSNSIYNELNWDFNSIWTFGNKDYKLPIHKDRLKEIQPGELPKYLLEK